MFTKTIEKLERMEGLAWRCINSVHYFDLTTGYPGRFWPFVQNCLGETACLYWSHLFGRKSDAYHYSNFFKRHNVTELGRDYSTSSVQARILSHVDLNVTEYNDFWKEVKTCRDKYIAHRDHTKAKIIFPRIDLCLRMTEEIRQIFSECIVKWLLIYPDESKLINLKKYYEWKTNKALEQNCKKNFDHDITKIRASI